jgi:glyoxylate reductase
MSEKKPILVIAHPIPKEWTKLLTNRCQIVYGEAHCSGLKGEALRRLPEADGLITMLSDRVDQTVLDQAVNLKVISNMAAGTDNIDLKTCTGRGIPVGNTPGALTESTADLAVSLMLAAARNLNAAAQDAKNGAWKTWEAAGWLGLELNQCTLGIIGMGKIGAAVARRARAFGMRIIYHNRNRKMDLEQELNAEYVSLDDLFKRSDIISLNCPLTPETRKLINRQTIAKMKEGVVIVNAARGGVIETDDLVEALKSHRVAAAGLDVTDPEPLPMDHPLYQLTNCIVVPHIGSATGFTRQRLAEMCCENIISGLDGERIPYCANPDVYAGK